MRKFVIDTSVFINPTISNIFGKNRESALENFVKLVKKKRNIEIYMPVSVFLELSHFLGDKIELLEGIIKKRSPNLYAIYLPAAVFYDFIEEIRERINKGLRLAEEFAVDNDPSNELKVKKLREKYRDAMRSGIVDSTEDFELILLAKELDATLVSADEGILKFANKIGCEILHASKLKKVLEKN